MMDDTTKHLDDGDRDPTASVPKDPIGHFRCVAHLGGGASGEVFLAKDMNFKHKVALKILKMGQLGSSLEELHNEASALGTLQHPSIVTVHEIGESPQGPFLAMEFMQGGSLASLIDKGKLPLDQALVMARQAADGLRAAHDKGILHRDVKPANMLLTGSGDLKLADFGLAIWLPRPLGPDGALGSDDTTRSIPASNARVAGTPGYMAPEVFRGENSEPRSDQFGLGATIHKMVTGKHPQEGIGWQDATLAGKVNLDPSLPRPLRRIVERCLAREPGDRFPAMADVVRELDSVIERRDPVRKRLRLMVIAAVVLVGIVVATWIGRARSRQREATRLNDLGFDAADAGRPHEALAYLLKASRLDPDFEGPCLNLGMLQLAKGDIDDALGHLEDCAGRFPESPVVLYGLGRALRDGGDAEAAASQLRESLRLIEPGHAVRPLILNELGLALIGSGQADEALRLLEGNELPAQATREGATLKKTLGLAQLEMGAAKEATLTLRAALEGDLSQEMRGTTWVALGRALEHTGDADGARRAYSAALLQELDPEATQEATAGLQRVQELEPTSP